MKTKQNRQGGFTLIEVIITIVIAALMGTIIFIYLSGALARSHEPVTMVEDLCSAMTVMEEVTAKYQEYLFDTIEWGAHDENKNTHFTDWLAAKAGADAGLTATNRKGTTPFGNDFDVMEVTVTRGKQTVSAFFTE